MKNNSKPKHKNVVNAAIRSANAALKSDDPATSKEAWDTVSGMKIEHAVLITNTMAKLSKDPLLKVLMKDPKSLDSSSPAHVIAVNLLVDFMALQFDFMHLSRAEIELRKSDTEIAKNVLQAEISYNQTKLAMIP